LKTRTQAILNIRFHRLIESLQLSELTEIKSQKGALNPYVSGLLLSASLMDEIRLEVPYGMHVGWGQVLDGNDHLSGEIDIFTYLGKPLYRWKDIGYVIVPREQVQSIFEVKRRFYSYDDHQEELNCLRNFASKIFLIIFETDNSMDGIKKREDKLRKLGYTDAFHLVRLTETENKKIHEPIYQNWYRLMDNAAERLEQN